jgi:acetyltransferase-like isoleucine patch superfamily enzyme
MDAKFSVIKKTSIGRNCEIHDHVNLFGCTIGDNTKIDAFVYIEEDVEVGANCVIRPFVFIPTGISIGDKAFIGPNVSFTNDRYPEIGKDWELESTVVNSGASIGAGATIGPGVCIGERALIGAGAVVMNDVPKNTKVAGVPADMI